VTSGDQSAREGYAARYEVDDVEECREVDNAGADDGEATEESVVVLPWTAEAKATLSGVEGVKAQDAGEMEEAQTATDANPEEDKDAEEAEEQHKDASEREEISLSFGIR